ncbi:MAG TPA: hypothetical protein P5299_03185 [Candidatus Woesebacteria bacterium]|nr:hypothetical protein [Candidatus Woesebacteria bacterium]
MYFIKYKSQILLIFLTLIATLSLWLTFYYQLPQKIGWPAVSLETVFANYDGPNYLAISKCGYDKNCLGPNFSLSQPLEYYPAHFPGYPMLIRFFSNFTTGPKAMLLVTLLGSILLTLTSYALFKSFWLSFFLLFFPPRLFILRAVGAPETWFMALTLWSILFFKRRKFFISAILASLSLLFKTPGVLLGVTYLIILLKELVEMRSCAFLHNKILPANKQIKNYLPYLLMPLVLLGIFFYYRGQTGDFWAYFHSGDNFHLNPLPYLVFISTKSWVDTIWLEDIIYIYFLAILTVQKLWRQFKFDILTIYPAVFTMATLFVAHRDISRYLAPVYPFVLYAFKDKLENKSFRFILWILLPAVFLYAVNFITGNTAPIADWAPYL